MTADATVKPKRTLAAYLQPKTLSMLVLGFSSGLPFLLVGNTLGYWLRDEGTSLAAIGFISWVGIAYSLKFLWAPVIDRVDAPILGILGRRRGWMALSQILVGIAFVAMAVTGTGHGLVMLGAFALVAAFGAATQDIVIDAWRIESAADNDELGLLSSAYQFGFRIALLATDAVILALAEHFGWPFSYALFGALMAVGLATTFYVSESSKGDNATDGRKSRRDDGASSFAERFDVWTGTQSWLSRALWQSAIVVAYLLAWLWSPLPFLGWLWALACLSLPLWSPGGRQQRHWLARTLWQIGLAAGFWLTSIAPFVALGLASAFQIILPATLAYDMGWSLAFLPVIASLTLPLWIPAAAADAIAQPFIAFFKTYGWVGLLILVAISFYRVPDFVMGPMVNPYYHDIGLTKDMVAAVRGTFSFAASFAGIAAGGFVALRFGYLRALIVGGVLQAAAIAAFAILATSKADLPTFIGVMIFDSIATSFAGVALVSYMSSLTSLGYTATQYALLASSYTLLGKFFKGFSGQIVEGLSAGSDLMHAYAVFFIGCGLTGIPGIILFLILARILHKRHAAQPAG